MLPAGSDTAVPRKSVGVTMLRRPKLLAPAGVLTNDTINLNQQEPIQVVLT